MNTFNISMYDFIVNTAIGKLNYYDRELGRNTTEDFLKDHYFEEIDIDDVCIKGNYYKDSKKFVHIANLDYCRDIVECFVRLGFEWDTVTCGIYVRYLPKHEKGYCEYYTRGIGNDSIHRNCLYDVYTDIDTIGIYISDPFSTTRPINYIKSIPFNNNMLIHKYIKDLTEEEVKSIIG